MFCVIPPRLHHACEHFIARYRREPEAKPHVSSRRGHDHVNNTESWILDVLSGQFKLFSVGIGLQTRVDATTLYFRRCCLLPDRYRHVWLIADFRTLVLVACDLQRPWLSSPVTHRRLYSSHCSLAGDAANSRSSKGLRPHFIKIEIGIVQHCNRHTAEIADLRLFIQKQYDVWTACTTSKTTKKYKKGGG
jgi:hypothetical protein